MVHGIVNYSVHLGIIVVEFIYFQVKTTPCLFNESLDSLQSLWPQTLLIAHGRGLYLKMRQGGSYQFRQGQTQPQLFDTLDGRVDGAASTLHSS